MVLCRELPQFSGSKQCDVARKKVVCITDVNLLLDSLSCVLFDLFKNKKAAEENSKSLCTQ